LREESRHGYDLKRLVDRYVAPDHPVAYAQVYATLERLERRGWVRVAGVERVDGPDRRRYAITAAGVDELERWLTAPIRPEPHLQTALYTKIVLAMMAGRPVGPLVATERAARRERIRELTEARGAGDVPIELLADHALLHVEGDLRWLDRLELRLDELRRHVTARPTSS
jgi:DNA-binding PadR family transcriptional regulator